MKPLTCAMICLVVGTLLFACTGDSEPSRSSGAYGAAPQASTIEIDASQAAPSYANFCRVTGTPEEVEAIDIDQRIVMNFYTAKRLLTALQLTVKRHEETFGELELDVQKRVRR